MFIIGLNNNSIDKLGSLKLGVSEVDFEFRNLKTIILNFAKINVDQAQSQLENVRVSPNYSILTIKQQETNVCKHVCWSIQFHEMIWETKIVSKLSIQHYQGNMGTKI